MPVIPPAKTVAGITPDEHDLLVYYVESRTPGESPWRVDLQKFCGNGHCDCPQFKYRLLKQLVRRALPAESLECWHIKQAKRYFTFECLNRIIEKREHEAEQNKKAARQGRVDRRISEAERAVEPADTGTPDSTPIGAETPAREPWRGEDTEDPDIPF